MLEASGYDAPRLGETLPPPARRLLDHLGVWDAFQRQGHREVYGTAAVWGGAGLHEHDFIYTPHDTAWHLDRAAFDAMLAREAAAGDTWLAVGDAASTFDPLSSQGLVKALRTGVFASFAIADLLTRDTDAGLARYRRYVPEEYASYSRARAKYYNEEHRWPHREFWRRRPAS